MSTFRKYRYLVFVMMCLLIIGTAGVTMNKHYCLGRLVSVSFYEKAENCLELMGFSDEDMADMKCCKNVSQELKLEEVEQSSVSFELPPLLLKELISIFFKPHVIEGSDSKSNLSLYSPPLPDLDIPVLIQSFLI